MERGMDASPIMSCRYAFAYAYANKSDAKVQIVTVIDK